MTFYQKMDRLARTALEGLGTAFRHFPHTIPVTLTSITLIFLIELIFRNLNSYVIYGETDTLLNFTMILRFTCITTVMSSPITLLLSIRATSFYSKNGYYPTIRKWLNIRDIALVTAYFALFFIINLCLFLLHQFIPSAAEFLAFVLNIILIAVLLPIFAERRCAKILGKRSAISREGKVLFYGYISIVNLLIALIGFLMIGRILTWPVHYLAAVTTLVLYFQQFFLGSLLVDLHCNPQNKKLRPVNNELLDDIPPDIPGQD